MNYNTQIPLGPFGNAGDVAPTGLSTDGTNVSLEYGSAHLVLIADADGQNLAPTTYPPGDPECG